MKKNLKKLFALGCTAALTISTYLYLPVEPTLP